MAITPITSLPAATSLNGNEQLAAIQAGSPVRITTSQIVGLVTMLSSALFAEQLTVSALNTLTGLTFAPKNGVVMLAVNAQVFFAVGAAAAFTVTGQAVHWTSSLYDLQTTDTVYAVYGV